MRRAYDVACQTGDLTYSAYGWHVLITNHLTVGDPLKVVQGEAEKGLAFATKQGFGLVVANCGTHLGLIRTLRGLTRSFGCFDDDNYNEAGAESHYASNPALVLSEFFYWTRKLQGRFIAGDYAAAVDAATRADQITMDRGITSRDRRLPILCRLGSRGRVEFGSGGKEAAAFGHLDRTRSANQDMGRALPRKF